MARKKRRAGIGDTQRRTGMTFPHPLDRVDGQESDRIG
jgi:hypothetical protein